MASSLTSYGSLPRHTTNSWGFLSAAGHAPRSQCTLFRRYARRTEAHDSGTAVWVIARDAFDGANPNPEDPANTSAYRTGSAHVPGRSQ
jgi:hypothetical protein